MAKHVPLFLLLTSPPSSSQSRTLSLCRPPKSTDKTLKQGRRAFTSYSELSTSKIDRLFPGGRSRTVELELSNCQFFLDLQNQENLDERTCHDPISSLWLPVKPPKFDRYSPFIPYQSTSKIDRDLPQKTRLSCCCQKHGYNHVTG